MVAKAPFNIGSVRVALRPMSLLRFWIGAGLLCAARVVMSNPKFRMVR